MLNKIEIKRRYDHENAIYATLRLAMVTTEV